LIPVTDDLPIVVDISEAPTVEYLLGFSEKVQMTTTHENRDRRETDPKKNSSVKNLLVLSPLMGVTVLFAITVEGGPRK
jgi:hypothetical protein